MRPTWVLLLMALALPVHAQDAGDATDTPSATDVAAAPDAVTDAAPDAATDQAEADALKGLPPAEPLSFKAALEKAEVTIGEPFALNIEVRHPATDSYSLPVHLDLKAFGVHDHKSETHGEDPKTTVFRLMIQAFDVGDQEIPAIRLAVDTPSEREEQLEIPPQKVKVTGVIDLTQGDPKMKEDARPLPSRYRTLWWPLWVALGLLAAALIAWLVWRRVKHGPPVPPPKPRPPPYDEAIERLAALERESLIATGQKQAYYFRLSEILRDYLGRRYDIEALELTTNELLADLRKRSTPGLDYDGLADFLRETDLVKFAKNDPTDGACKTAMDRARSIIQRTRPPPPSDSRGGTS